MTVPVDVHVTSDVSLEALDQLFGDLRAIGLDPTRRVVPTRRGIELTWLVLLALPMKLFVDTLVQQLAGDVYSRLKVIIDDVFRRSRKGAKTRDVLVLQDLDTHLLVEFEPDLTVEAYRQLFQIDLASVTQGPLRYDRNRREWRGGAEGNVHRTG
jgi:hypothetical protein